MQCKQEGKDVEREIPFDNGGGVLGLFLDGGRNNRNFIGSFSAGWLTLPPQSLTHSLTHARPIAAFSDARGQEAGLRLSHPWPAPVAVLRAVTGLAGNTRGQGRFSRQTPRARCCHWTAADNGCCRRGSYILVTGLKTLFNGSPRRPSLLLN